MNDEAVVLRLSDFSETSQVATLLSRRHGILRLLAKGARRSTKERFVPGLDLLEWGDVLYRPARGDGQLGTLAEWKQRELFLGLRDSLVATQFAQYAAEITTMLIAEDDPHEALFDALLALLGGLAGDGGAGWIRDAGGPERQQRPASSTDTRSTLVSARRLIGYQQTLIWDIGLMPQLDACVACGRERAAGRAAYFSPKSGGVICRSCAAERGDRLRLMKAPTLDLLLQTTDADGPVDDAARPPVDVGDAVKLVLGCFEFLDECMRRAAERETQLSAACARLIRREAPVPPAAG
ncbi:MAG: DNA repair protein RecO [Phycisphaerae bacterium]|nr:DNA repair protein RecO [Phycisphaerae bacterium]